LYNLRMSYIRFATAPPPKEEPKTGQSESNSQNK
jgi:hypothetical protein